MKKILFVSIALSLCLACGKTETKQVNTAANTAANTAVKTESAAPANTASTVGIPKDGNYNGKGKVTKINMELGSVELDHEDIPDVMPRMIMEFYVKDKSQLNALKVGDKADFVLEYKHPTETIVSIKKAQ